MVVDEYSKFKLSHPLDRIIEELEEIKSIPSDDFTCLALEGNFYDWQYGIRGLNGTEFEGGIYHGRIQFPEGYPRQLPKCCLLTENGCFETQTDISFLLFCRESFTVRDALPRLIELLPTYPDGALGSVGCDKEKRRALAIKSRKAPPKYGTAQRQKLINKIHECMLRKAPPVPSNRGGDIRIEQNQMNMTATTTAMDIEKELKELQSNPSQDFKCIALAGNIYNWQLAIRGPNGTEFEGGIYHALIQFPEEYPRKRPIFTLLTGNFYDWLFAIRGPNGTEFEGGIYRGHIQFSEEFPSERPVFTLLTENGCLKTQTDISFLLFCQEQFTVRHALLKLIELLPTYLDGALGSARYDKEERRALAIKSCEAPPIYGTAQRQKLINEIHECMLWKAPPGEIRIEQNQMYMTATSAAMDIEKGLKEMQSNPSDDFKCIALPENGCFETQTDISFLLFCRESFTVRDVLYRLIEMLHTYPVGELGSVRYDKEERRALAIKSREATPIYGTAQRQKLINEIEQNQMYMTAISAAMDIEKELKEMQSNPSDDFKCIALPGNVYDWQIAIRGPNGTEFEGGIYHGRIQFPEEYPHKRPIFKLLTENGRFQTQTEIWFPWHTLNVRDTLHKLIELLPTYPDGALGSVRYDKEERRALAIKSREAPPRYGTAQRQKLINEIHECMLSKAPLVPSSRGGDIQLSSQNDRDNRKRGKSIQFLIGNTLNANNSNQVGIFDFDKSFKKAKQDVSSRETGSTSIKDNQE